jgi:hypothetical protein
MINRVKLLVLLMTNLWMGCRLHRRNFWMILLDCKLMESLLRRSRRIVVDIVGGLGIFDLALEVEFGNGAIGIDGGLGIRADRSFPMVLVWLALLLDSAVLPNLSATAPLRP